MKSMYTGNVKFIREQLVFVAELSLTAAMDQIESVLPDSVPLEEYRKERKRIDSWVDSAMSTAGLALAILYAQLTNDGLGIGDALDIIGFRQFIDDFVGERTDPNWPGLKPGDKCFPDCHKLAEKFVDEMFPDTKQIVKIEAEENEEKIIDEIGGRQGWNENSKLALCLEYIDNQQDNAAFKDFLEQQAADENYEAEVVRLQDEKRGLYPEYEDVTN